MNRTTVFALIVVLAIGLAGFFGYRAWSKPQVADEDPVKVIASNVKVQKDGSVQLKLDDKSLQSIRTKMQQQMLDEYFALAEGKPRKDYLDKKIDEMEKVRKMMDSSGPTTQPGTWTSTSKDGDKTVVRKIQAGGPTAAMQKEMAENIPAELQAKLAQYVKDMKDRRAERGLPDGPAGVMIMIKADGPPK